MNELFAVSLTAMFHHEFMRNAFIATSALAPACGLVGYFLVLRNQVFAGDALSHVGFTGSLAALAFGVNQQFGLFTATVAVAIALALLGNRSRFDDTTIGIVFMWILGLGVLCLSIFTTHHSATNGRAGPNVLFGSVLGISEGRAVHAAFVCSAVVIVITGIARPLLFASIDEVVAAARGVRVNALSILLLLASAIVVAEATQLLGALLLLGLLTTPAATAYALTRNPYRALLLASVLCLVESWIGLTLSYAFSSLPPSFVIIGVTALGYAFARAFAPLRSLWRYRNHSSAAIPQRS